MNMPSPYQDAFFEQVSNRPGLELLVVFDSDISMARSALGWETTGNAYKVKLLNGIKVLSAVLTATRRRGSVQLMSGVWAVKSFLFALAVLALTQGGPRFIYAEPSDPTRQRSRFAKACQRTLMGWLGRCRNVYFLGISRAAREQALSAGFPRSRILPFAYFTGACMKMPLQGSDHIGLRLVYAGQLVNRKGLHVLLSALEPLWRLDRLITLDVYGDGPELGSIKSYMREHSEARIALHGSVPWRQLCQELQEYDVLLLPSRFDGWGVVVNEAQSLGVSVVVSDGCGAAELVDDGVTGFVFPKGDVAGLRQVLLRYLAITPGRLNDMKTAAATRGRSASARAGAEYFLACVAEALSGGTTWPNAPWLRK
jgi:glycosyltransferase involved in cell wall biosynthesis